MALVDDITKALQDGAKAGAAAASTGARDLSQDVQNFVVPHLHDIGVHVTSILEKRALGIFTDDASRRMINGQRDSVQVLVDTITSLAAQEAETIVNAIIDALHQAVNTALKFALFA